jgi:predicted dehydrogenase
VDRIRIGIVGSSAYVERVHLPLLIGHPQALITGVCGRHPERTAGFAARHSIPEVYAGIDEMLAADCVDAVVIAAPDDLHYGMTLAALEARKHVLCEKPLALNAAQAREMRDLATAQQLKHMVFFRWRWLRHIERMKKLMVARWIGKPRQVTLRYLATYGWQPGYAWRFDEERANGVLGDLGSHMIDLALWLFGDVLSVSAHLATTRERHASDGTRVLKGNDRAIVIIEFSGGAQGVLQLNAVAQLGTESQELSIEALGDEGFLDLRFPRSTGPTLRGGQTGQPPVDIDVADEARGAPSYDIGLEWAWSRRSVADRLFIDAILADVSPAPTFDDGVRVQEVIDAVLASHSRRRWVPVERGSPDSGHAD